MRKFEVSEQDLINAIKALKPGWIARARNRTDAMALAGAYDEGSHIWGEIKELYMRLQGDKCAYCERLLAGETHGKVEHDVEHFRPKKRVDKWTCEPSLGVTGKLGAAEETGYFLLAYNPFNYVTACGRCNTGLKGNYFPIAGQRNFDEVDPSKLLSERPYLIYPLASWDVDPISVIGFDGMLAVAANTDDKWALDRAKVTIDFFDLNGEDLVRQRAGLISMQYYLLEAAYGLKPDGDALSLLEQLKSPFAQFSSCAISFEATFLASSERAKQLAKAARAWVAIRHSEFGI